MSCVRSSKSCIGSIERSLVCVLLVHRHNPERPVKKPLIQCVGEEQQQQEDEGAAVPQPSSSSSSSADSGDSASGEDSTPDGHVEMDIALGVVSRRLPHKCGAITHDMACLPLRTRIIATTRRRGQFSSSIKKAMNVIAAFSSPMTTHTDTYAFFFSPASLSFCLMQYDLKTRDAVEAATRAVNEPESVQSRGGDRREETGTKRRKIEQV